MIFPARNLHLNFPSHVWFDPMITAKSSMVFLNHPHMIPYVHCIFEGYSNLMLVKPRIFSSRTVEPWQLYLQRPAAAQPLRQRRADRFIPTRSEGAPRAPGGDGKFTRWKWGFNRFKPCLTKKTGEFLVDICWYSWFMSAKLVYDSNN